MPKLLENISYDSEGLVVGATSLMNVWLMEYNAGEKVEGQARSDPTAEDWEEDFIGILVGSDRPDGKPDGVTIYCLAERRCRFLGVNFAQTFCPSLHVHTILQRLQKKECKFCLVVKQQQEEISRIKDYMYRYVKKVEGYVA